MKLNRLLLLFALPWLVTTSLLAQKRNVTGKVLSAKDSSAIPAASIMYGSESGTSADDQGNFSLSLPDSVKEIQVSALNFLKQTVSVSSNTIVVYLQPFDQKLDEVVVIGYGTARKKDLTGSVATVSPKDFNQGVVASPDQLLAGKVAGLNITRNSGDPTGGSSIQLRGPSSLTASVDPFYVIDGVPGANISLVAPSDIISMDILKDASSTAIYGSRAANGVIMVTTKRGKSGKPVIAYNGYGALETIAKKVDVLSAADYTKFLADNNMTVAASESGYATDWQKELFRKGLSHNHNISLSGGNNDTKYSVSANYFKQEGIVKKNDLERFITRMGIDQSLFDKRVRLSLNMVTSTTKTHNINYGIFGWAARFLPVSPVTSDDAGYDQYGGYFQVPGRTNYFNPVAALNQKDESKNNNLMQVFGRVEADVTKDLLFTASGSIQRETYDYQYYGSIYDFSDNTAFGRGLGKRTFLKNTDKVFETNLTYSKTIAALHQVKAMVGYSYQNTLNNDGINGQNNTFSSDGLGSNNLGMGGGALAGDINPFDGYPIKQESTLIAYFGRVNYAFNDKYLLTATIRRDGSSKFGKNNKWATFPSVSAAWRIIQEGFMSNQNIFSDLKLRVGYGVSGNQNITPYASITQYGTGSDQFLYNGEFINSIAVSQNPNPDLKWETTKMINIGLDFALLKGVISGTVEYYDKKTSDLLYYYNVPTPPYLFNTLLANGGSMTNKGIEVTLNATIIRNTDFQWKTFGNFAKNNNKIGSISGNIANLNLARILTGGDNFSGFDGWTSQTTSIVIPGQAIGTFFMPKYVGYDAAAQKTIYETPSGNLKTADQLLSPDDYQIVGRALPKFTYGWGNNFNYKQFDLGFFLRGVYGNKIYNATRADLSRLTQASVTNISPLAVKDGVYEAPVNSSRWLESGSFLRMDNATLGYTVPMTKGPVKNLRVYFTGTNLFTITKYTGVDPEVNMSGLAPGVDSRNYYPKTRSFLIGVNVSL